MNLWDTKQKRIAVVAAAVLLVGGAVVLVLTGGDDPYEQLNSDDADQRREAVRQLGTDASGRATEALIQASKDPADRVACEAVVYLARRGGQAETRQLVASLRNSRPAVRAAAAAGLGQFRLRKEVPPQPLIELVADRKEDARVRAAAADSLGRLERFEAMPALVAALEDPSAKVRGGAGRAIKEILGRDFGFRANGSNRALAIQKIKDVWRSFEQPHRNLIRKIEERQK